MKKKSYLNSSNVGKKSPLNEFNALFPKMAAKLKAWFDKKQYQKAIKIASKSPEFKKAVDDVNKASKNAETAFEKQFGVKIKLSRAQLKDFF